MHNTQKKDIREKECLIITRITCTTHITRITLKPQILGDKGVGIIRGITRITIVIPGKKIISKKRVGLITRVTCLTRITCITLGTNTIRGIGVGLITSITCITRITRITLRCKNIGC